MQEFHELIIDFYLIHLLDKHYIDEMHDLSKDLIVEENKIMLYSQELIYVPRHNQQNS